ncbi:unnamed protein product [Phytophthora fragariaefolia]|uniref:Unnamed protein product n=1 Tax=Phytophthora fragariaefolia TaxID=1490495 RepID=A0A9W6WVY1_9STRA|nr:unnamed protein product [Phytophthora fragariaefolia]
MELRQVVLLYLYPQDSKAIELHWPVNSQMREIVDFGPQVSSWVNAIHNVRDIVVAALLVIPSMRSSEDLKKALDQVELCYEEAVGSDHLLMNGFPAKELADLAGVLQRRKDRQVLLSTRSQRVLKKLHIAKSWSRQTPSYASKNTGCAWKDKAIGIQAFLNAESKYHQATTLAEAYDWKPVNSIFCLKFCESKSNKAVELLISVLAWSESLGLVRWCSMQDALKSSLAKPREQYFSLANAKQYGIYSEVKSYGDRSGSEAVLQALQAPSMDSTAHATAREDMYHDYCNPMGHL